MKPEHIGWLAGIFDGEGSLTVLWPKRSTITVEIKMTCKHTIDRINELFPGNVSEGKLSGLSTAPQWRWRLSTRRGAEFLKLIMPHLVTKKEQASLCLDFASGRPCRVDEKERNRRNGIVARLRSIR